MRGLTGALIGSAATAVVLIGGFALARYQSSAAAQDAACTRSLGYVQWIPTFVESNNASQAATTADDAARIISDVKKVYSDCGRPYSPQP
jgi:hypothetical protein